MNIKAYYKASNGAIHWGRIIQFVGAPDIDSVAECIFIPTDSKCIQALPITQIFFSDQFDVNTIV